MKTLKIILTKVAFCGDAATMESSTKECSGETCHQNDRCPIKSALIRYYHQNRNIAKQFANLTKVFFSISGSDECCGVLREYFEM